MRFIWHGNQQQVIVTETLREVSQSISQRMMVTSGTGVAPGRRSQPVKHQGGGGRVID